MQNQFRLQGIPTSSSGKAFLGHMFDLQYDGYLQKTENPRKYI